MVITMFIFLIIGFAIIGYIRTGYAPDRVLKTEIGHIYYWGIGKRILGSIRVTLKRKLPFYLWWLAEIPLPAPFVPVKFHLKWTEVMTGLNRAKEKSASSKEPEALDPEAELFFVERDEWVDSLRIYEQVDFKIPIISEDGFNFFYILTVFFEVFDDMGPIGRPDFKLVGGTELQTKIAPWGRGKDITQVLKTDVDDLKNGITFNGDVTMQDFLDRKVRPLGCKTHSIALQIIPGANTKAYFKKCEEEARLKQEKKNQAAFEELQVEQRKTKLNDAKNDAEIDNVEFNALAQSSFDFVEKIYEQEARVKAARPHVFVEANTETKTIGATVIEKFFDQMQKATGRNIAKERREEEQENEK